MVREVPVLTLEHTSAVIGLGDENLLDVATGEIGVAQAGFASLEVPVLELDRGWFVGARWGYVGSAVPGRPAHTFLTDPEVWWRVASVGDRGIASGAELAAILPFARELDEGELAALRTARVVRPADDVLLRDRSTGLRPAFDVRLVAGDFVLQLRQGVDLAFSLVGQGELDLVARGAVFAGWQPVRDVLVGAELRDVYALTEQLQDDERAAVSLAPGVRARWGRVSPAATLEVPLSTPLGGEARAFVAVELGVSVELGTRAR
jgi:hypothetical protein